MFGDKSFMNAIMSRKSRVVLLVIVFGTLVGCSGLISDSDGLVQAELTSAEMKETVVVMKATTAAMTKATTAPVTEAVKPAESKVLNAGNAAPVFSLMSVKGKEVSLEALKGEKVYLKFWASWCSICLAGMEDLNT